MKMLFVRFTYMFLLCTIIGITQLSNVSAQTGFGAAKLISTDEQIQMTFHRSNTSGVLTETPLTALEVDAGFKNGDAVGIRYRAPFDSYVYIVNVSQWDGITLQYPQRADQNAAIPANKIKDFAFGLENTAQNTTTGREELLVMVTKEKIENPDLTTILNNPVKKIAVPEETAKQGQTALKNSLAPAVVAAPAPTTPTTQEQPTTKKQNKLKTFISLGCNVASIFFPFAKVVCAATGFGAARYIEAPGNASAIIAENDTKLLTMRFSFSVAP